MKSLRVIDVFWNVNYLRNNISRVNICDQKAWYKMYKECKLH